MKKDRKWQCEFCAAVSVESELLTAPNPFNQTDELIGCPVCKSVEGFIELCEIEGCTKGATCGGPGNDGVYRRTCGPHADWLRKVAA